MRAGVYNLVLDEGADVSLNIVWKDDSDSLIDLTGYTARMMLKNSIDGDVSVDWSSYISLGGVNGTIDINVPASQTIDIGFLDGKYDLELESTGGNVYKILRGKVLIHPEVTT